MEWDSPDPPTQRDVLSYISQKRTPYAPPAPTYTPAKPSPLKVNIQRALTGQAAKQIDTTTPDAWLPPVPPPQEIDPNARIATPWWPRHQPGAADRIDTRVEPEGMPSPYVMKTPLDIMAMTGSATARAGGSLLDRPGDVGNALIEGGKGLYEHVQGKPTSWSEQEEQRTGRTNPAWMNFIGDVAMDVGNVVDPMNIVTHGAPLVAGLGMAAKFGSHADDAARAAEKAAAKAPRVGEEAVRLGEMVDEGIAKRAGPTAAEALTPPSKMAPGVQQPLFETARQVPKQANLLDELPPEIVSAVEKAKATVAKKNRAGVISRSAADIGKSNISVIRDSGKTGPALARLITRTRLDAERLAGQWTQRAKQATEGLSKAQIAEYVRARDTGYVPADPQVQEALMNRLGLEREIESHLKSTKSGYKIGKKAVTFGDNAWPRIYPEGYFKNKDKVIEELQKQGLSEKEAERAYTRSHSFNSRLIDPKTGEQLPIPGYRTDPGADYMHLNDMAKRVTQARAFGANDIANPKSPIMKLIEGTDDPKRVMDLVRRHLGKEAPATQMGHLNTVSKGIIRAQTMMHLSQFALSNISQQAAIPLRGNMSEYVKALTKTITKGKTAKSAAEATGALQTIEQDVLREVGGESWFSKMYGMKKSESFNRTVAALTGKGTAESLFDTLKKNPANKRARQRLENLILEPVDKLLKQGALTEDQLGRAGGRMAEITQGRAQSIDLPKMWADHPVMDLILLFKKYSFRQSRIIVDAIKENPKRNIPLALALYAAQGEVIGDTKAAIKGIWSEEGSVDEIKNRGSGIERLGANLAQSWAFGLLADALSAARGGPVETLKWGAGPVANDVVDLVGNTATGNTRALAKQGYSMVPYFGSGMAQNEFLLPDKKSRARGGGLPSLRGVGPKLPSLGRP